MPKITPYDDIIVIRAYKRPEYLFPQIGAFIDNMILFTGGHRSTASVCNSKLPDNRYVLRKLLFIVLDDSPLEFEVLYNSQIKKLKDWIETKGLANFVNIEYFGRHKQQELVTAISKKINTDENSIEKYLKDAGSPRSTLGGIRGICNLATLVALSYGKDNSLCNLHFLDDDIFPYVLWYDANVLKLEHLYYFFGHKAWLLENKNIRLVGAYYTVDSPSPIIDLFEALWFTESFLSKYIHFRNDNNPDAWRLFCEEFEWIKQRLDYTNISEELRTINGKPALEPMCFATEGNFEDKFSSMNLLWDLVLEGNNRLVLNTANFSQRSLWHGARDYFSNGCVSGRYEEFLKLYPFPIFGNQELILFPYEYAKRGGIFWGDYDVAHIKSAAGRQKLLDDLNIGGFFQQKHNFKQLSEIIQFFISQGIPISEGIDTPRRRIKDDALKFSIYGSSLLSKIEQNIGKIESYYSNFHFSDKNLLSVLNKITTIKDSLKGIKEHFSEAQQISIETQELASSWIKSFDLWEKIKHGVVAYSFVS